MLREFMGYPRMNETAGTRGKVLVLATVHCSYIPAREIARFQPNTVAVTHHWGCRSTGEGQEVVVNCLAEICKHPNIGAVLLVGHGCEEISVDMLAEKVSSSGKPCESIVCQDIGSLRAITRGRKLLAVLRGKVATERRKKINVSHLTVAVQCGASDYSNGLFSNRAVGKAVDYLIEAGATVIFAEVGELIGVEKILEKRAATQSVAKKIRLAIEGERKRCESFHRCFTNHGEHGNVRGGLSTIEEKSAGAIFKTGSTKIQDVLEYSPKRIEKPTRPGLYLQNQNGFGSDVVSITAMASAGAQIAVFVTGSGSIVGHAIIPVFKVTANELTYRHMKDNIDYFVPGVKSYSKDTYADEGVRLANQLLEVASGNQTKAEFAAQDDFSVLRVDSLDGE